MNWDQVEGKWKQYKGQIREKWGELTDDDIHVIGGRRDELIGKIQERYGFAKEKAAKEVDSFVKTLKQQPVQTVIVERDVYVPDSRAPKDLDNPRTASNELREKYKVAGQR
jgi:uncharacterized protein YjbJ (UPF0337 family)